MTHNTRKWLALFCLLLLIVGCGKTTKTAVEQKAPVIAIVDWQAVWQAHPQAKQWQQKHDARLAAEKAFRLKEQLLHQQQQLFSKVDNGRQGYLGAVVQTKMAELEAQKREQMLLWEHDAKMQMEASWRQDSSAIEEKYQPELANLQLKLAVLQLPKEDRARLEAAQTQALQRRDHELREARRAREERYFAARADKERQLSAQSAVETSEVMTEVQMQAQRQTSAVGGASEELADNQQALLMRIEQLKQEEAALAERMENDIRSEAERLAVERNFDVVMRQVIVNVNAVDITQDLIKALRLREQTKKM